MDSAFWSRMLTEETLAFHIIWAAIGVGVPIFISLAELIGIRKKDIHYTMMAKRWTRGFVITVAVGVVTGTCIGVLLSLLWPTFMQLVGNVISLPLFLETFAFFFEAIFLGIYLYTWDRFKNPYWHWITSIPVIIGSTLSAVFITTVNSFMNTPAGFKLDAAGKVVDIDPIGAMLNPATPSKVGHVVSSSYLISGLLLAGLAAFFILRGRNHIYYKKALKLTMVTTFILSITTILMGDISAKFLAEHQPAKLAAAEWHFETKEGAPLVLFGTLDPNTNEVKYAIEIPKALSILATNSPNGTVVGLDSIPKHLWPPLYIHYLFDTKVSIGFYLLFITSLFLFLWIWKKGNPFHPLILYGIVIAAPLSFVAMELGWIFAEVGRLPWIITGIMKVGEAATTAANVKVMYFLFTGLYLLLAIVACIVLYRLFKGKTAEAELEASKEAIS